MIIKKYHHPIHNVFIHDLNFACFNFIGCISLDIEKIYLYGADYSREYMSGGNFFELS
jgi:hypothetical protein